FSRSSLSPERNRRRVIAISPARTGTRPNLRRRTFSTTLLPCSPSAAAGASLFFALTSLSYVCPGCASITASSVSSAACARSAASSQSPSARTCVTVSPSMTTSGSPSASVCPSYTSGSTSVSDTSAMPVGLRSRVPAKMTSSILMPRRLLADCSPSTHVIASDMFDFPQPLGPTMAAMPSPASCTSVRSQNDLKPRICTFLSLSKGGYLVQVKGTPDCGRLLAESYGEESAEATVPARHLVDKESQCLDVAISTSSLPCAVSVAILRSGMTQMTLRASNKG